MRFYRKLKRRLFQAIVLMFLLSAAQSCIPDQAATNERTIESVVDGDTIVLAGGERVRLIGIDTPETKAPGKPVQCYGPEASNHTKSLLPKGTRVKLVMDVDSTDRYERTLAYVYRSDGLFVNADLVEKGFAKASYVAPNKAHRAEFQSLESQAKSKNLGRWASCPTN